MLRVFNIVMLAFMLAPLVMVVWMSFTPGMLMVPPLGEFSLRWYAAAFAYPGFVNAFWLSARLALVSGLAATLLSFVAAYGLVRGRRFRGVDAVAGLFLSPLIVPAVVFGIAMLQFVNAAGLYNSFLGLALAHVVIVTPFAVRTLMSALAAVPIEVEWAAMNLGASRAAVLFLIVLPVTARAMLAAFLLTFLISFSEVTVTVFMTGPSYQTLPVRIYNYLTDQVDPTVAAVSAMLIGLSLVLIFILDRLGGLANIKK
ncbi:MAG: ABC transporter permease [Rhodobacteraceae bacterium]|nr:ABC transporter permease [Paracoccaceae bacterium]